ncbi:hypothetical protein CU633_14605 [Bacillus sp. V3-13]|nr:hypothetical protein CU633_14605 [Bacillus sp. V3-13]
MSTVFESTLLHSLQPYKKNIYIFFLIHQAGSSLIFLCNVTQSYQRTYSYNKIYLLLLAKRRSDKLPGGE